MDKLTKGQIQALLRALDEGVYGPTVHTAQFKAARLKLEQGLTYLKEADGRKEKMNARSRRSRRHP